MDLSQVDLTLITNKVIAIAVITVLNTVFTLIPLFLTSFKIPSVVLESFNSVGAGLILGISVLGIVSPADSKFEMTKTLSQVSGTFFVFSFFFSFVLSFYFTNSSKMRENEGLDELTLRAKLVRGKHFVKFKLMSIKQIQDPLDDEQKEDPLVVSKQRELKAEKNQQQRFYENAAEETKNFRGMIGWVFFISLESFLSCIVLASQTRPQVVWIIFMAIVSGDWAEDIILGQKIHKYFKFRSVGYQIGIILMIQLMNVLGFGIGLLADILSPLAQEYISTILLSSLSGFFLYMTMIDMIIREMYATLSTRRNFLKKCILISLGLFGSVFINIYFAPSGVVDDMPTPTTTT